MELLRRLRAELPSAPLFVSTTTLAGRALADQKLAGLADGVFYAPIDFCFAVRRVLRTLRPAVVVVAETEIWPNLYREAKRAGCGLAVVNGRISDRAEPTLPALRVVLRRGFAAGRTGFWRRARATVNGISRWVLRRERVSRRRQPEVRLSAVPGGDSGMRAGVSWNAPHRVRSGSPPAPCPPPRRETWMRTTLSSRPFGLLGPSHPRLLLILGAPEAGTLRRRRSEAGRPPGYPYVRRSRLDAEPPPVALARRPAAGLHGGAQFAVRPG